MNFDLLINAIIAGLMLGGFYAAVTAGVSISFGMLDIVNIAHPGFIILGSYIAYIVNITLGIDPIVVEHRDAAGVLCARRARLSDLLPVVREARPGIAARARLLLRPAVRHRGRAEPGLRRRLPLGQRALYRRQRPPRRHGVSAAHAGALPGVAGDVCRLADLSVAHLHRPRGDGGVAGPAGAATDGGQSDAHQADRLRHIDRHRVAGRRLPHHHPAGDPVGRPRLYRPHLRHLRARRIGQPAGDVDRGACCSA